MTHRMGLTITTIVCAYNESRLLPACLHSLLVADPPARRNPGHQQRQHRRDRRRRARRSRRARGRRAAQGTGGGARDGAPRRADRHRWPTSTPTAARRLRWLERVERAFHEAARAGGGDRPVPLLRLGLERPRADARLRPAGRAADARARCITCSASARSSTAATSRSGATRSRAIGGFDRRIEFHGEDTNLGRRLTPIGRVALCHGLLGLDVGAPLPGDGEGARSSALYVRNFWSEILRHRPADGDPSRREGL